MKARVRQSAFLKQILLVVFAAPLLSVILWADSTGRTVTYDDQDIIPVHAKIRFSTLIVLPANEEILDATTGDKEFWIINGAHNLCYLHPAQKGIRSNLNLITSSGHVYSFLLTEVSDDPKAETDLKIFVTRKEASSDEAPSVLRLARASELQAYKAAADTARTEEAKAVADAKEQAQQEISRYREEYVGKLKFDYLYNPAVARSPFAVSAIYHDDRFTYIDCAAEEKPTIYEMKDGKPSLINFDLENGVYVIPKILDEGYLVAGKKKLIFVRRTAAS